MITKHLSDFDIQQWVLDKTNCDENIIEHIHECEHCKTKAEAYQLLFSEIKEQPKPAFDFNLSEIILPQISPAQPAFQRNGLMKLIIASFAIAAIGIASYLYKIQFNIFYKKYILDITSSISKGVMYLLLTSAFTLLIFQSIALYKKYQRKIDDLNFY